MSEQIIEHYEKIRRGFLALMECYLGIEDFAALQYVTARPCRMVLVATKPIPADRYGPIDFFASLSPNKRLRILRRYLGQAPSTIRDAMALFMKTKGYVVPMARELYGQGLTLADAEQKLAEIFQEIFAKKKFGWALRFKRVLWKWSPSATRKLEELEKRDPEQYDVGQKIVGYMWEIFFCARKLPATPTVSRIMGLPGLKENQATQEEVLRSTDKLITLLLNPESKEAQVITNSVVVSYLSEDFGLYKDRGAPSEPSVVSLEAEIEKGKVEYLVDPESGLFVTGRKGTEPTFANIEVERDRWRLQYERVRDDGQDEINRRLLDLASEYSEDIKRDKPLSQALPPEFYQRVPTEIGIGESAARKRLKAIDRRYKKQNTKT